ncbi:MAG: DUF6491 family protein [Gammaproteobacteria bacterium]|nr:DUF6491 family protein [Gammaproteobacteria bacterium]
MLTKSEKSKTIIKQILISFSLSILVACAGTNSDEGRSVSRGSDCIYEPSIRGYKVLDESNLIVSTSGRRKYQVTLQRRAFGLQSSWGIAFRSQTNTICSAFSEVLFEGHFDDESIRIASIRRLSPEEEEDLLIRYGKKKPEIEHTPVPQDLKGAEVEELDPAADDE